MASGLREFLRDEEVFLMDHYAGKEALRATKSFFLENSEAVALLWSSEFVQSIEIRMSEMETCEHRMDYFHRAGIIRDVIANHLQLVLGVIIDPSLEQCAKSNPESEHETCKG
ncbi:hypothetical protein PINS_up009726 [Pythium insidiosum]|nr:hypothetical protein PINS_up009726 [Pythium insidiosum]